MALIAIVGIVGFLMGICTLARELRLALGLVLAGTIACGITSVLYIRKYHGDWRTLRRLTAYVSISVAIIVTALCVYSLPVFPEWSRLWVRAAIISLVLPVFFVGSRDLQRDYGRRLCERRQNSEQTDV